MTEKGMARTVILMVTTFMVVSVWANTEGKDVHIDDVYPALAFLASIVVAVLGFLLKWLLTRDREAVDIRIDELHKHINDKAMENKAYIDGLGVKVERLADMMEEKIGESVEELRRHDAELFTKWDALNREFGQLKGEHQILHNQGPRDRG